MSLNPLQKTLAFASLVEVGTGLVLMTWPAIVIGLLIAGNVSPAEMSLGRIAGIALLALGLACWPDRGRAETGSPAYRGMLTYNVLVTLYFAYLGVVAHEGGLLLWPAMTLHVAVILLLLWTGRGQRSTR